MKKHTQRKKWLSMLLVIMMLVSLMPVAAFADEDNSVVSTEVVSGENQGNVEDNEQGKVEDNEQGKVEDNEQGNVEDNEQGNVEDNEQGKVEDNEQGSVEDNEQGSVEDNEQGSVEDNEQGNVEDNEQGNVEDNKPTTPDSQLSGANGVLGRTVLKSTMVSKNMVTLNISSQGQATYSAGTDKAAYKGEITYSYTYDGKQKSGTAKLIADGSSYGVNAYDYQISVPADLETITLKASGLEYIFTDQGKDKNISSQFMLWGVPEKNGSSLKHEVLSRASEYTVNLQELNNSAGDYAFRLEVVFANNGEPQDKALYAYGHVFDVDGQSVFFDKDGQPAEGILEEEPDNKEAVTLRALAEMPEGYENYALSFISVQTHDGNLIKKLENGETEVTIQPTFDPDQAVTVTFMYVAAPVQKPTVNILTYFDNVLDGTTGAVEYDVNHEFDLTNIYKDTTTHNGYNYKIDFGGYAVGGKAEAIDIQTARDTLKTTPYDKLTLEAGNAYQIHVYYQQQSYDVTVDKDCAEGGKVMVDGKEASSPLNYKGGEEVTLAATANAGYYFAGWEVVGAEVTEKDNTISFTMPEGPVVVKAYFEKPYTVKYYENEINKANYLGTVPCATNGKENSYPGTYDIAASREDVNGFDSSKNYEGYSFWKEENGQLVAGEKYTVNVAEDRTMTYGEQEKYEYIFVVKAPKEMHDAQITVTYKDAGGNVLQDAKSLAVTFNPDSLLEGKVALGSLIAEEGALEALLEKYIWVQAEGKEYQLTNRPAENTEIAMTAGQNEGYSGAIDLVYAERHNPVKVVVQYHNESGATLRTDATTTAQYNINNVSDNDDITFGDLKDAAGQIALNDLILAQLSVSGTTYNLTNTPAADTILKLTFENDEPVVTIALVYRAQGTTGPVNPGGDITPGGDPGSDPGDGGGDYTGGTTDNVVIPDNTTPLAPNAPVTPDNTVVVPAEAVIDENEVPLGAGPQGSSENPKTGAEKAKDLGVIALLLAVGALGIEFKRKKA